MQATGLGPKLSPARSSTIADPLLVGKAFCVSPIRYNILMTRLCARLLLLLLFCMPLVASAQSNIPLFDSQWQIVPDAHEIDPNCPVGAPLGFGGTLQLIQNLMNATVSLGVIIAVMIIVFAGILWLLTPTNPENHSQAKKVLTNAVIGLLIILSSWLIVDFVMKIIYNGDTTELGPWNEILMGGDICVVAASTTPLFSGSITSVPGEGIGGTGGIIVPRAGGSGACSPTRLMEAAQSGGITLSAGDAKTFACIARYESTCGTRNLNYRWNKGSSAAGAFQVLLGDNAACYENAACRSAAGVTGRLNCQDGFRNGNPIPGSAIAQRCVNAAANLSCSISAAVCVKNRQGWGAWTADRNSSGQNACIRN